MESILQDIRFGARALVRNPLFTLVAVLALALGIGANTAIFSVLDAVVLKPLPYSHPEQLVQLWMRFTDIGQPMDRNWVSPPEFADLRNLNKSLSQLAAIDTANFNLRVGETPERLTGALVSASFFPLFGVQAQIGRVFLPDEDQPGRDTEVLLSDGLWRSRFGADPGISGRKLVLSGKSYIVVGVLPRGFDYPVGADIWTPLAFSASDLAPDNRGNHGLQAIARIRPAISQAQARSDLDSVSERIIEQNPGFPYRLVHFKVLMVPLLEQTVGDVRTALWVLMSAVGFVLLIACANVANLLLVRASSREREMAVRVALGAGRWRLIRQLLTESIILALAGGSAGLLLAEWTLRALVHSAAGALPRLAGVGIHPGVMLFTMFVSLGTGIVFGLVPAIHASAAPAHDALKEGTRGSSGGAASGRLRGALVVAEVALSLMLLVGAGLLLRSFLRLQQVDPGFRPEGVLTLRIALPEEKYPKPEMWRTFFRSLLDRVRPLPGVESAGLVNNLPLSGSNSSGTITADTTAVAPKDAVVEADWRNVSPDYFRAMRIPLLRGRYFDAHDSETSAPVAIVDETMARTFWPHQDAVGQRIRQGGRDSMDPWRTIVGLVGVGPHVHYRTLEAPSRVAFYWPHAQRPSSSMSLAIRTSSDPRTLAEAVRREVLALDPDQPVYKVEPMLDLMADSIAQRRLSMWLLAVFAGLAMLLAAVGIYGVISYSVSQRWREIGIRMALGAGRADVLRLILGQSLLLALTGILIGIAASLALTGLLTSLLFEVQARDPLTFAAVAALLLIVAVAASYLPAYRATAVGPSTALRQE
jgi:predicted permease